MKLDDYRYYRTKNGTLYCGNALKIIPLLKKEQIDLLYTDPVWPNSSPELIGHKNPYKLFKRMIRKSRKIKSLNRYAVHLGIDSDPKFLQPVPGPFIRAVWLRYVRPHPKGRILYSGDICYLYGKAQERIVTGKRIIPGEVTNTEKDSHKTGHPCSRVLTHSKYIIDIFSNPGEVVFDPFGGAGTTPLACEILGRKWIVIEIEEKHCKRSAGRLEKEAAKFKLDLGY